MMKTIKKIAFVAFLALISGASISIAYRLITYIPPETRREMEETDRIIAGADVGTDEFTAETREHRQQVIERTVVIREKVQADIGALDPDGLARAALSEIELWRGSSGDSPPARPSGLDD